jgi:hypothetical protein
MNFAMYVYCIYPAIYTTGATSGTGTAFPSGVHLGLFGRVAVFQSLVFCVVFSRSYFVPFRMTIVMYQEKLRIKKSVDSYAAGVIRSRVSIHYNSELL